MISDPEGQRKRWAEYFSELLNPPPDSTNLADLDNLENNPNFSYLSDLDGPPTKDEIAFALAKLKNYKTPGVDGISNEHLKHGSSGIEEYIFSLFEKIWNEEKIPEDWSKGVIITLGKKGAKSYCTNNRGITLRSTASQGYQIIILKRLDNGLESLLRENQCGFRI